MAFSITSPGFNFGTVFNFDAPTPSHNLPSTESLNWDYDSRFTSGSDSNVATFQDQGPDGIAVTKFASGINPTRQIADLNGLDVIQCPGDLTWQYGSTQFWNPAQPYSALIIAKLLQSDPPYYVLSNVTGASTYFGIFIFPSDGATHLFIFNGNTNPEAMHFDISDKYLDYFALTIAYNGNGFSNTANWDVRVNGQSKNLIYEASVSGGLIDANYFNTGSSSSPSINIARNLSWNSYLDSSQMDQLDNYVEFTYALADPFVFSPLDLAPKIWYDYGSLDKTGTTVSGFIDKSGNGINANFSGGTGTLLPNAINGIADTVQFSAAVPVAYIGGFNDTTKRIDQNTPFATWGVCSCANWYSIDGGVGYSTFWQLNDGLTTMGLNFTTQDPANWPGYPEYLVFAGDGITDYVGGNWLKDKYNQYFSYLINYKGGGDFSDVTKWEIYFNSVPDTIVPSPAYQDVLPNVPNQLLSGVDSSSIWNTHAEFGFIDDNYIQGADLTNMFSYLADKYGTLG